MFLTILIPCHNEEDSIGFCVTEAKQFLLHNKIDGEVLVINNRSTDRTAYRALLAGARVEHCSQKGYGSALRFGINKAAGDYIIMGDGDGTYDFSNLMPFINKFNSADIVIGNRYTSLSEKGAVSFSHKMGGMFLSFMARRKTKNKIIDFHCGLRGGKTSTLRSLNLKTEGFEFATEMIMKADNHKIEQIPIKYRKAIRKKNSSKLNPLRDGFRHLFYIWRY